MRTANAIISCDYDDGRQSTYRAFIVRRAGVTPRKFATGKPDADYQKAVRFCQDLVSKGAILYFSFADSVDFFGSDGSLYRFEGKGKSRRLIHVEEQWPR